MSQCLSLACALSPGYRQQGSPWVRPHHSLNKTNRVSLLELRGLPERRRVHITTCSLPGVKTLEPCDEPDVYTAA